MQYKPLFKININRITSYTRLFGHGEHNLYQFDDAELLKIDTSAKEICGRNVYLTFHGARMYSDAARLKVYEKSGTFPKVTKAAGLASLKIVLENLPNGKYSNVDEVIEDLQ